MKTIIAIICAIAVAGCASVTLPDGTKMPAGLYANQMQTSFAASVNNDASCNLETPKLPPGTEAIGVAFAFNSWREAVSDCTREKKETMAAVKPESYLQYDVAKTKAIGGLILGGGNLLLNAACMFRALGACGGNNNSAGDNYESINIVQTGAAAGGGSGGKGGEAAGGSGGAGAGSGPMGISIGGYGNMQNSTNSGITGYGVSGDLFSNSSDLNFGSLQYGGEQGFNGTIDDQSDNAGF